MMDYNALVRFLFGSGPGADVPKRSSSHPKNIYREPIARALKQAPAYAPAPKDYYPLSDSKRYRDT
jgi:hypothetical protein